MQSKVNDYDRLQKEKTSAEKDAQYYYQSYEVNRQRAEKVEKELVYLYSFPEITALLEQVQRNIAAFKKQVTVWIADARKAIREFANLSNTLYDFSENQQQRIFWGILAQSHENGLDATDEESRHSATEHLLEGINWSGTTDSRMNLARTRAFQFSDLLQKMLVKIKTTIQFFCQCASGRTSVSNSLGSNGAADTLSDWRGNSITSGPSY